MQTLETFFSMSDSFHSLSTDILIDIQEMLNLLQDQSESICKTDFNTTVMKSVDFTSS